MPIFFNLRLFAALVGLTLSVVAQAEPVKHGPTPEQVEQIGKHHQAQAQKPYKKPSANLDHPVSDLETAGYLFFSGDTDFESEEAKKTMARELPNDVTLVIFIEPGQSKNDIRQTYKGLIPDSRFKVVEIPNTRSGFWARDGLPIAVWNRNHQIDMVDARYYHGFEPDRVIAGWFQAPLLKHDYYYEGGNFQVNDLGDCVTVDNNRSCSIPLSIFRDYYGCKNTIVCPMKKASVMWTNRYALPGQRRFLPTVNPTSRFCAIKTST